MDDSCRVLPRFASPLRYFAVVFYEKGRQSLTTVYSVYKKVVLPTPFGGPIVGNLLEHDSLGWIFFSMVPLYCMIVVYVHFTHDSVVLYVLFPFYVCGFIGHVLAVYSVAYWYRDMPYRLIGPKAKFMIEVIPMITAAALHHLLQFNYGYLALVLGCSTYFYAFAHMMRRAYDIGGTDVLLGIIMQVLAYKLNAELLVRALALSFCIGLCMYRYITYCAPEVPSHWKKELEGLPC